MSSLFLTESAARRFANRVFKARTRMPLSSGSLWKIDAGVVRSMTVLEDGTPNTLGIWGSGDVVGQALSTANPFDLECLSQVEAQLLPAQLWHQDVKALTTHVRRLEELLLIRSYRRVDEMLLKLLGWLARRFGREVDTGQLIDLRLTHQDLSEMLGTTRVTVTRVLSQLEQQDLIQRLPLHRIVVKEYELWHYEI